MDNFVFAITAPVPPLLIAAGLFFCFKLRFFWFAHPKKLFSALFSKSGTNGVPPLRAMTLALSGTLGVGNIIGVASAIAVGGFGAVFWMWISAVCAAVLKYAEIVLSLEHRRECCGERFGGAPYYIMDFLHGKGFFRAGAVISVFFAAVCTAEVLSTGCGIQINAAASALEESFGIPPIAVGTVAAALTVYAVSGGAERTSKLTAAVIPALSLFYIAVSFAVLFARADALPRVFSLILSDAFDFESAAGGALGFIFCRAVRVGSMRGLLSNEAGCGTSPLAHASSSAESSAEQGVLGILEVLFDTVFLCTLTAAVIIISYEDACVFAAEPIKMALCAYSSVLGEWIEAPLSLAVAIFGISTVICCAHYARECVFFIFKKRTKAVSRACLAIYAAVIPLGACTSLSLLWHVSDISLGIMTAINVTFLLLMRDEISLVTKKHFGK